jgi:hypothetical protein
MSFFLLKTQSSAKEHKKMSEAHTNWQYVECPSVWLHPGMTGGKFPKRDLADNGQEK